MTHRIHRTLRIDELEPRVAPAVLTIGGTTNYSFTDSEGNNVSVTLSGATGSVEILDASSGDPSGTDIDSIEYLSSDSTTNLTITVTGGTGDGITSVGSVDATGDTIGSFVAEADLTDLTAGAMAGDLDIENLYGTASVTNDITGTVTLRGVDGIHTGAMLTSVNGSIGGLVFVDRGGNVDDPDLDGSVIADNGSIGDILFDGRAHLFTGTVRAGQNVGNVTIDTFGINRCFTSTASITATAGSIGNVNFTAVGATAHLGGTLQAGLDIGNIDVGGAGNVGGASGISGTVIAGHP